VITEKTALVECRVLDGGGEIFIDGRIWTNLSVVDRMDLLSDWIGGLARVYDSMGIALDAELLEEQSRSNMSSVISDGEEKGNG